jgi:hypothetical protein
MTSEEPAAYRAVVEQLLAAGDVTETQMMGMPALKAGTKMFGGRSGEALVLKLGRELVEQLVADGRALPFDPSGRGRPMKDWALLPPPADDWAQLAGQARELARG